MDGLKRFIASLAIVGGSMVPAAAQSGFSVHISSNILWMLSEIFDEDETSNDMWTDDSELDGTSYSPLIRCNAGLKYQFDLLGNLTWWTSADVFYKKLKDEPVKNYWELEQDEVLPATVNVPIMLGLNWAVLNISDVSLWTEAGVGLNLRRISSQKLADGAGHLETVTSHHLGTTAAWKVGVGVTFDEVLSLQLQYFAFDNSEIKGRLFTGKRNVVGDWAGKLVGSFADYRLNHSVLFLCLGVHF